MCGVDPVCGWTVGVCWVHAQTAAVLGVVRATAVGDKARRLKL